VSDTYTVLIVDDEVNVLKALRRLFLDTDYRVLTATSGPEGLKLLDSEPVNLVISDYRMPDMNGVEFLARIKEDHPDTIRMILSGFADVTAIVDAINDGEIYKFLAKPWNDQELLSTVRRALEHSCLQRENVALLSELQSANVELKKLAEGLEYKVRQRTRDLEHKSRAVNIAHNILNLLPIGVIGMDSNDTIVYMNERLARYIDVTGLGLGGVAEGNLDPEILEPMREALSTGRPTCAAHRKRRDIAIICTALPSGGGVIALIGHLDLDAYHSELTIGSETEATHD